MDRDTPRGVPVGTHELFQVPDKNGHTIAPG